jgi:thiaminase/transcriptional activator TenA
VYAEVGRRLAQRTRLVTDHPFARWTAAYDAEEFHASVAQARRAVDEATAELPAAQREAAHDAFATAVRYELMFWETAAAREDWPLPL